MTLSHWLQNLTRVTLAPKPLAPKPLEELPYAIGPKPLFLKHEPFTLTPTPYTPPPPPCPAHPHPTQTTQDIGNFWRTSYADVQRDMRARHPKHYW